jgi:hypothetical protein
MIKLSIDEGSEPISGSLSADAGAPQQFRGWIELVAAIEALRHTSTAGAQQGLGAYPVASGGAA